jgi:predicted ATPase
MIRDFTIRNYKSILDHTIELGRINVFIGENGSGKTNILEAMAMASEALGGKLDTEGLYSKGVRVVKPSITFSSFLNRKQTAELSLGFSWLTKAGRPPSRLSLKIFSEAASDIEGDWVVHLTQPMFNVKTNSDMARLLKLLRQHAVAPGSIRASGSRTLDIVVPPPVILALIPECAQLQDSLDDFAIYNLNVLALRGIQNTSRKTPLGIFGENLDVLISTFKKENFRALLKYAKCISWLDRFVVDVEDELKLKAYKLGLSTSTLYFRDRFMRRGNNTFSAENANEGILHILFYLALFISDRTPKVFGIDNIETALNPQLCRDLMKQLAALSKEHDKQALITTHNAAVLDGLNLHDDDQRLFVVSRNDAGHTVTERIRLKPEVKGEKYKLSELWMRGHLGGLPRSF